MADPNNILSFYNENLQLHDYRLPINATHQEMIVARCKEAGLLRENEGWVDYRRIVLRLLLNPSSDLISTILSERQRIGPSERQIGAHIRCGGVLADTHEGTAMITLPILQTIPRLIANLTQRMNNSIKNVTVYVSTDSSYAYDYLVSSLPDLQVVSTTLFQRGHAEFDNDDAVIKRTLIDLFLMSQSNAVILTSSSAFSRIIREMGSYSVYLPIYAPYSHVNIHINESCIVFCDQIS